MAPSSQVLEPPGNPGWFTDVIDLLMAAVRAEVQSQAVQAASVDTKALEAELVETKRQHKKLVRMMAAVDDDDATMLVELKECVARMKELERSLAVVTRAQSRPLRSSPKPRARCVRGSMRSAACSLTTAPRCAATSTAAC
jgi:hypothetical protein